MRYPPGFVRRLGAAKLAVEAAKTTDARRYALLAATINGALPDGQNQNLRWILLNHAGPAATAAAEGKPRFAPALILYLLYWCQRQAFAMIRQMTGPRGPTLAPAAGLYDDVDIEGPIRRYAEQVFERFIQHCIVGGDVGENNRKRKRDEADIVRHGLQPVRTKAIRKSKRDEADVVGHGLPPAVKDCKQGTADTDVDPWAREMAYGPGSLLDKRRRFVDKVCAPFAAVLGFPAGVTMTSSPLAARV